MHGALHDNNTKLSEKILGYVSWNIIDDLMQEGKALNIPKDMTLERFSEGVYKRILDANFKCPTKQEVLEF